jgi:hypothetical protein
VDRAMLPFHPGIRGESDPIFLRGIEPKHTLAPGGTRSVASARYDAI